MRSTGVDQGLPALRQPLLAGLTSLVLLLGAPAAELGCSGDVEGGGGTAGTSATGGGSAGVGGTTTTGTPMCMEGEQQFTSYCDTVCGQYVCGCTRACVCSQGSWDCEIYGPCGSPCPDAGQGAQAAMGGAPSGGGQGGASGGG